MCFQYAFMIHNLAITDSAAANNDVLVFLWHVILECLIFIFHSYCYWVVYAEDVLKTKSTLYKQEDPKL